MSSAEFTEWIAFFSLEAQDTQGPPNDPGPPDSRFK